MTPQGPGASSAGFAASAASGASPRLQLAAALFAVYLIWGSSYLALKQAVSSMPALTVTGQRALLAGLVLLALAAWRRQPRPTLAQAGNAALAGALVVACSSALLAEGMRSAGSGSSAVLFATMPIFACLMTALSGGGLRRRQWAGSLLGLMGVGLLHAPALDVPALLAGGTGPAAGSAHAGGLAGTATSGHGLVLASAAVMALGAVVIARSRQPASLLWAAGLQALCGGLLACAAAWLLGEPALWPSRAAGLAMLYLTLVVTVCGYLAYNHLSVRGGPVLATSYAYVNPPVALLLGVLFLGETLTATDLLAMALVLAGAALVVASPQPSPSSLASPS